MDICIMKNVCLEYGRKRYSGSRLGTAFITLEDFARKFGPPLESNMSEEGIDGDGKVHATWSISTPRGICQVYDYWWNPKDQLSIGAPNRNAALWVRAWLRRHGVRCSKSIGK